MKRTVFIYTTLIVAMIIVIIVNINMGSVNVSIGEVLRILINHDCIGTEGRIIWDIRIPRIVAAMILGGGLAVSGYMLQTFFHNTIAGPFVLGISSGAKLMVAILMVVAMTRKVHINSIAMIIAAFIGALIVTSFVLAVSSKIRHMSILIVCGVMVGYICSAITELVISFADDSNIVNLHSWSMGTFSGMNWDNALYYVPITFVCIFAGILLAKSMEAYSYGEEYAQSLGVNIRIFRVILIIISSILSATVTAFAGPISFVGIAIPHIIRVIFKSDKPILILPASFLGGGIFCLFSDLLARKLFAPTELSISTITAVFGAPVVIIMLLKRRKDM